MIATKRKIVERFSRLGGLLRHIFTLQSELEDGKKQQDGTLAMLAEVQSMYLAGEKAR